MIYDFDLRPAPTRNRNIQGWRAQSWFRVTAWHRVCVGGKVHRWLIYWRTYASISYGVFLWVKVDAIQFTAKSLVS